MWCLEGKYENISKEKIVIQYFLHKQRKDVDNRINICEVGLTELEYPPFFRSKKVLSTELSNVCFFKDDIILTYLCL